MKSQKFWYLFSCPLILCSIITVYANNRPNQRPNQNTSQKPTQNTQNLTYEQIQQQQHEQTCNILGYASNIFNNFVHLVSRPNDQANIGAQVGNMAQNLYHIVAEATKASVQVDQNKCDPENCNSGDDQVKRANQIKLLEYLQSQEFVEALTKEILKVLNQ